jgi:hypothetical protein
MQQFIGVDDAAAGTSYRLGAEQYHAVGLHSQGMGLGRLGFGAAFFNRGASALRFYQ